MAQRIPRSEFSRRFDLPNWRLLNRSLVTDFNCGSFLAGAELIAAIAGLADDAGHHPDLDLHYPATVRVSITSHNANGLTAQDADLATAIDGLALKTSLVGSPLRVSLTEVAIDALNIEALLPFWKAVLGYVEEPLQNPGDSVDALVDPGRREPALWFQQMTEPRPQRSRIHLDIRLPHDVAEARITEAIAAGGTLVTSEYARAFWVLADPEGNEICICTWQDRD
jgi:4a-hydroxytetrahydrobiopterin dehydratase